MKLLSRKIQKKKSALVVGDVD